jgi:hypothetical protein
MTAYFPIGDPRTAAGFPVPYTWGFHKRNVQLQLPKVRWSADGNNEITGQI